MTSSTDFPSELARLRELHEAAQLRFEIRQLRAAAGLPLVEEWGDVVDRREAFFDDGLNGPIWLAPAATLDDRRDGRFRPVYETEHDLARIRGAARQLAANSAVAVGALDALANYTLGSGFTFTAHSDVENPRLETAVQRVIDEFIDEHEFCGTFDRELHRRSREDGEAFVLLYPLENNRVRARFLEPEQISEPADPAGVERWLGDEAENVASWTFGVHAPAGEPDAIAGYHVLFDSFGRDWDYIPADQIEHVKRNVPRNAKRGVSDFHAIQGDLEREAKLRRNTAEGAALQAAVAWVIQAPLGSTQAQMQSVGANPSAAFLRTAGAHGSATQSALKYGPGTILKPSPGLEYKPGPMGSERNPNFVLVAQYILRSIGVRWNMPEYLISGDAGNANYASTLVAESPFVKAREADQQFYRRHFHSLIWKVLRLAWQQGRFERHGISWRELEEQIDVKVDVPSVSTRDPLKLAQTQESQVRLGILSRPTAAAQAGLNYDVERSQGANSEPPPQAEGRRRAVGASPDGGDLAGDSS
ncbi:MAG: phage portal protein [Planctomycetaceae bacterium]